MPIVYKFQKKRNQSIQFLLNVRIFLQIIKYEEKKLKYYK
jgi:hypothetical protein